MAYDSNRTINPSDKERTLKGLSVNTAALLCYVGVWISGIIFLILEQKNRFIRFHALQSIITFGILFVAGSILGRFPDIGGWLETTLSIAGFVLWIILMVKAGQGELFKLPWVGDLAEKLALDSIPHPPHAPQSQQQDPAVTKEYPAAAVTPQPAASPNPVTPSNQTQAATAPPIQASAAQPHTVEVWPPLSTRQDVPSRSDQFRARYYSFGARTGRIVGSAFTIICSIALLIFFNFFHQYIAYYHANTAGGTTIWEVYPLVTGDFQNWLPIITVTLALSIVGHAILIVYDKYIALQITRMVVDCFSIAAIITLLSLFPFDFSPIPNNAVVRGLEIGLPVVLILSAIGTAIGVLVRFINMIVHIAQNKY